MEDVRDIALRNHIHAGISTQKQHFVIDKVLKTILPVAFPFHFLVFPTLLS
jgi:hypothetical protein